MKGYSIKSSDWETIYPIGSIYMSTNSASPASLFGGTWTQIQDQFLLCSGSTYAAGSTGGSATMSHTHSVTAKGTNTGTAITAAQMPKHGHNVRVFNNNNSNYTASAWTSNGTAMANRTSGARLSATWMSAAFTTAGALTVNSTSYGTGDPCGVTEQSGGGSTHTHTFTGTAVTSGAASNTNNMPPYLAVYVWKRTA